MFRIAHLTDPHVGPLPRPKVRELLSKRLAGYYNWRRNRRELHNMDVLAALVADMRALAPDHIACTGDLCNIGLESEWKTSRVFMESLGPPETVTLVPGNHDAYVPGSLEGLLRACAEWTSGDDGTSGTFPFVRRAGAIAFIGLSSAVPTAPFVASGRIGRTQMEATERLLLDLGKDGCFRVVLVHHPPHVGGAKAGRHLTDSQAFEAMIRRAGAELILHGHNHVGSLAWLDSPGGRVPVIGAPSASIRSGAVTEGGYHLYAIDRDKDGFFLTAERRGFDHAGKFGTLGMLALNR